MKEKIFKKNYVYRGRVINVRNDTVILPNKRKATREFMEHPGAVAALTFLNPKKMVLLRQYRYPVKEVTWEIPAGKLDKNEKPLSCIKRELAEETGMKAKRFKHLIDYWPTSAFSTELIRIYVAWDLSGAKAMPDDDEFLETRIVDINKCYEWIKKGRIRDSKTIIAFLAWANFGRQLNIF